MLLGKFLAVRHAHQWGVHVGRVWQAQSMLKQQLAWGVVGQIFAAHHMGNILQGIVHHDGQLVGLQAIGTLQDKVSGHICGSLLLRAQAAVVPAQKAISYIKRSGLRISVLGSRPVGYVFS